jgi:hypothetical protein
MFKPSLLEVIALTTKDGGTLLNRRSTKFSKLILSPESWTVNQRFIGNASRKKKRSNTPNNDKNNAYGATHKTRF